VPKSLLDKLRASGPVPAHVAIIMDGNGRWARQRSLPRPFGHQAGMTSVREAVEGCLASGVGVLTLFAFSQENWQRPAGEIAALMALLEEYIAKEMAELREQAVAVTFLGDLDRLVPSARDAVDRIMTGTRAGRRLALNICVSYGSRAEITRAARLLAEDVRAGRLAAEDIDEDAMSAALMTAGIPDPDLLIRTSGEQRISNFLLWQSAYTEFLFVDTRWPDFGRREFADAIAEFQRRERRYGAAGG